MTTDLLKNKKRLLICVLAIITLLLWASAIFPIHKTLNVTFLDVGEGLCVVAQTPSGKIIVMDCGTSGRRNNESVGQNVAARYIQQLGADKIDLAILSHPHSDHVSGYAGLIDAKPVKTVLDIGVKYKSPYYYSFLRSIKKCNARYRIAKCGQKINMGDGVVIEILNPSPDVTYTDLNENSIVARIVYKHTAVLFTGDADRQAEDVMLKSGLPLHSQLLQVGHHGSETSTSSEWLAAVRPQVAVISCGKHNKYKHPSQSTLARLYSYGCRVYRTDKNGAVQVVTDGNTLNVCSCR